MTEIARQEAVAARLQARQSTFLALIATIFLPITTVAVGLIANRLAQASAIQ